MFDYTYISGNLLHTLLGTIVTSLAAILAIVFSISLIAIQHAADKYVPRVLKYYVNDNRIRGVYCLFFVGILFGVLSLGFEWGIGAYISFLLLLICLVCVYGQFKIVADFINPIELIKKLKEDALGGNDESKIEEILVDLRDIAIKSEEGITSRCIDALEEIAIEKIIRTRGKLEGDDIEDELDVVLHPIYKSMEKIGVDSARKEGGDTTNSVVEGIYKIYKKVKDKKQGKISSIGALDPASIMRIVGEAAAKYKLNRAVVIATENIKDIGIDLVNRGLSVDNIRDELGFLGIKAAKNELNATINVAWALRDISKRLDKHRISERRELNNTEQDILRKNRDTLHDIRDVIRSNGGPKDILQKVNKARDEIVELIPKEKTK